MGSVNISKSGDEVTPFIQDILDNILGKTSNFLDDVSDIEVDYMQSENPIGETQQLNDLTMWEPKGELVRYIFSAAGHFEPIVEGHVILGPMLTERQRKWWFWYLFNVLGGDYDVKYGTGNKTPANDYPTRALVASDDEVDVRAEQYLDDLFGG